MNTKHAKTAIPSDSDLKGNPMIGGSKGATMAAITPDELEQAQGENTIEGDVENGTNSQGGVNKVDARDRALPR